MKAGFVEWPEGLQPAGPDWDAIRRQIDADLPDLLITNEMPFGDWLASAPHFDRDRAKRSVDLHEKAVVAMAQLGAGAILSSRPVWSGEHLVNEAFVLANDQMTILHQKRYFPAEDGWHETTWFVAGDNDFTPRPINGLMTGTLLCTELMFNEHARGYGKAMVDLIAVPRATGSSHQTWRTAGAMAAIVSGSYVISSNRLGRSAASPNFGGHGMAFSPDGALLAETTAEAPYKTIELDLDWSRRQKTSYPCYVKG
jgi:N-carbamoylputrescine amidase